MKMAETGYFQREAATSPVSERTALRDLANEIATSDGSSGASNARL